MNKKSIKKLILTIAIILTGCSTSSTILDTSSSTPVTRLAGDSNGFLLLLSSQGANITRANLAQETGVVASLAPSIPQGEFLGNFALTNLDWGEHRDKPCFIRATYTHMFNPAITTTSIVNICRRSATDATTVTPNNIKTISLTGRDSAGGTIQRYATGIGVCRSRIRNRGVIEDSVISGPGTDNTAYASFRFKGIAVQGSRQDGSSSLVTEERRTNCDGRPSDSVQSCPAQNFINNLSVIHIMESPDALPNTNQNGQRVMIGLSFTCRPRR